MQQQHTINEKWIKASILGTVWAASEIVFGSFLHNLKIPFGSNLLTAIGIIILVSTNHLWNEKGLCWRAGLICALMKTISPSAVVFGPMIAIFSQAALMELSIRFVGKNYGAYYLGAILAMSWNIFHKAMNFIITYGYDIVKLYGNILAYAQKQLRIEQDIFWLPIVILFIVYAILGVLAAIIGIRIGKKLIIEDKRQIANSAMNFIATQNKNTLSFDYSIAWLCFNIVAMIGSLVLLNFFHYTFWLTAITSLVIIWSIRYKRALKQLMKPNFWVLFIIITLLTAFVATKINQSSATWESILFVSLAMNFRAALIITGFTVLGTELYNPIIKTYFLKTPFKQLPLALELSFEILPTIIANIPDFKSSIKQPIGVIYQVLSQINYRLEEIKNKLNFSRKIFILTGEKEQGKTAAIQSMLKSFEQNNISVGGIYSPRVKENDITIGYDIVDIHNNKTEIFLREKGDKSLEQIGKFHIFKEGLATGKNALNLTNIMNKNIIVIDEVGKLELENNGWFHAINDLLHHAKHHIVLVVRNQFVKDIIDKWHIEKYSLYDVAHHSNTEINNDIVKKL